MLSFVIFNLLVALRSTHRHQVLSIRNCITSRVPAEMAYNYSPFNQNFNNINLKKMSKTLFDFWFLTHQQYISCIFVNFFKEKIWTCTQILSFACILIQYLAFSFFAFNLVLLGHREKITVSKLLIIISDKMWLWIGIYSKN